MAKAKGFPWLEAAAAVGGMGVFYYLLMKDQENQDGRDLWPALGFPYGPVGNLASIGADFKSGANRRDGHNALPVPGALNLSALLAHQLTDTTGAVITDIPGTALTDVSTSSVAPTLTTSRNAAGLGDTFNHSGSKPAWPRLPKSAGR